MPPSRPAARSSHAALTPAERLLHPARTPLAHRCNAAAPHAAARRPYAAARSHHIGLMPALVPPSCRSMPSRRPRTTREQAHPAATNDFQGWGGGATGQGGRNGDGVAGRPGPGGFKLGWRAGRGRVGHGGWGRGWGGGLSWQVGKNVCTARKGVRMCGVKNTLRTAQDRKSWRKLGGWLKKTTHEFEKNAKMLKKIIQSCH